MFAQKHDASCDDNETLLKSVQDSSSDAERKVTNWDERIIMSDDFSNTYMMKNVLGLEPWVVRYIFNLWQDTRFKINAQIIEKYKQGVLLIIRRDVETFALLNNYRQFSFIPFKTFVSSLLD